MVFQNRVTVFKEIQIDGNTLFIWFRLKEDDDENIEPYELVEADEHWARLSIE